MITFPDLKDKVVVITGGSSGIGAKLCSGFTNQQSIVYNLDRQEPSVENGEWIETDLQYYNDICTAINIITEKKKKIDILINCAGTGYGTPSEIIDINYMAPYFLIDKVSKIMIDNKTEGSIINIGSFNTSCSMPGNPPYVSSKTALQGLTKSFAVDLGKYNIRVNTVHPGYIETPLNKVSMNDDKMYEERRKRTVLGRWGNPTELVNICLLLASYEGSSYITGSEIYVDGGWTIKAL